MQRLALALPLALAACVEVGPEPQVSAFNGETVTIRSTAVIAGQPAHPSDLAKARELCPNALHIGTVLLDGYAADYLFRC
jgi:hypothetical protein